MSTTEQIVIAARELGKLIQEHPSTLKMAAAGAVLQKDTEAVRLLNDLNRLMNKIGEKEATGAAIEVAEKQQVQQLQTAVSRNETLRQYQLAQMDYLDLMRVVDQIMSGEEPEQAPAPAAAAPKSKIII